MPTTKKVEPAINDSDIEFHHGELSGQTIEATRIKKALDERYLKLTDLFNSEINIATRYELKVRIDEVMQIFQDLFGGQ